MPSSEHTVKNLLLMWPHISTCENNLYCYSFVADIVLPRIKKKNSLRTVRCGSSGKGPNHQFLIMEFCLFYHLNLNTLRKTAQLLIKRMQKRTFRQKLGGEEHPVTSLPRRVCQGSVPSGQVQNWFLGEYNYLLNVICISLTQSRIAHLLPRTQQGSIRVEKMWIP